MRKGVRIAVAALTLALPASAAAESLSYVEGGNVFLSTSDGARRVPITSGGSDSSPYTLAGTADSGKTQTAYGSSSSKTWFSFKPDGTSTGEQPNLVPMKQCGGISSIGPISPRLHPDGDMVAFNYFCNGGAAQNFSVTLYMTVDLPKYYTSSTNAEPIASDLYQPSFFGKRLVVQGGGNIQIQNEDPNNPFTTNFSDWIIPDAGETLTRAEVSRPGGRVVLDYKTNNTDTIAIGTYQTIGQFTTACVLGPGSESTFSPDGNKLAWVDSGGLKVGTLDLGQSNCITPGSVHTLSASGSSPRWSAYTIPEPVQAPTGGTGGSQPGGGAPPPTGQGTTPPPATPAPLLSVALAAKVRLSKLLKGLVVGYSVNGPGTVAAALLMPAAQAKKLGVARVAAAQVRLGYARKVVTAAGAGKLTVKLTKKAKRRAKRLKGRTLTLRTTFTPKAGTAVVAVKKIRVR